MAFHLIPFIAGATVGGLATYLLGDKKVRQDLKRKAGDISEGIGRIRKKDAGETAAPVAKKTAEKKPAANRTVSRKAPAKKPATAKPAAEPAAEKQPG